ncbi:MAG TPA: SpoIIE family protein phosphatase [Bacteroidia bacterium]|nr:SpoIIE family protein phosphatase [Bacteroidia bacterium]HNP97814.1 SpoIIE family protein phosphatase [Bacteroidia bacterium]
MLSVYILLLFSGKLNAETQEKPIVYDTITWSKLEKSYDLKGHWYFHRGDSLKWADPMADDRHWHNLLSDSARHVADSLYTDKYGLMWFRTHLWIDTSVTSKMMAMSIGLVGACEVYIDGKYFISQGKLGLNGQKEVSGFTVKPKPYPFYFTEPGAHTIAFRVSNFSEEEQTYYLNFGSNIDIAQFSVEINRLDEEIKGLTDFSNEASILIFAGIFITLTLFHFVLFLYYRKNRTNLYYSLFTFLLFCIFFGSYQIISGADLHTTQQIVLIAICAVFLVPMFFLALLYQVFYKRLPTLYWVLMVVLIISGYAFFFTEYNTLGASMLAVFLIGGALETIHIFIRAWFRKKDGAGIFLTGILIPPVGTFLLWLTGYLFGKFGYEEIHDNFSDLLGKFFGYSLLLGVSVSMTIYLARDFARMNKRLQLQLREIKQLFEKTVLQESERKKILEDQNTELERKVEERTAEVLVQKAELETKNRDILDNLNYARRIQSAILPETQLIYKTLADSFILYIPKDIVSGDFYTFSQKDKQVIISAADCTGHGVTGAFMSMIGSSLLNQIVNERGITQPAQILNQLNSGIAEALKQNENDVNDGMDIALCSIDLNNLYLEFSGANRPLWIIRNGEWSEIKADKMAIGGFRINRESVFTNHRMQLQKGDSLYLFTDGFADQFGGPSGKKMLSMRFREFLLTLQNIPMKEQEQILSRFFNDWKKNMDQVDDVLVIGIRV